MFKGNKKQVNAQALSTDISAIVESFTNMIDKLQTKADVAQTVRISKEAEMLELKKECDALQEVRDRALSIADKIANIFK